MLHISPFRFLSLLSHSLAPLRWRRDGGRGERGGLEEGNRSGAADQGLSATMLLRRVAAADDGAGAGAGVRRPRLFAVPRLLVGLGAARCGAAAAPDCDSPTAARSPTSPLDLRPFGALGGSLLRSPPRSPRSWDSHRVGLGGLVDDDAGARNRLLGPQMRQPFKLPQHLGKSFSTQPRDCGQAAPPVLGNVGTAAGAGAGASGKPVLCSRSYGDVKSGPEVTVPGGAQPGASSHPADLGNLRASGSLPASIGGPRRYIGSVSATEVEQSEDYTCIIAHGPNPKTTRIYGDCILEPCTVRVSGGESMDAMEVKEGAESYWLVKRFDDGEVGEEILSSCTSCKKNLDGNDSCIHRGEKAYCSGNCRDNKILTEENSIAISSLSSASLSSSFNDDIFMAEMVVLTAPVDAHLP